METTSTTTDDSLDWLEVVHAGTDRNKPTFRQLRDEGLSREAIETLLIARDGIACGSTPEQVADFLRLSQDAYPVDVEDVWPDGVPEHWQTGYDPTDDELAASWAVPGTPHAHQVAWTLHQELHDRSAS